MSGPKKLRVGILFGGRSGEHEVSLASAASVIRALDPEKYEAVPIGITKEGRWLAGAGAQKLLSDVLKTGERVVLPADPSAASLLPVASAATQDGSHGIHVDVMFPVLHGTFGEDGTVQGLLELAGLPYVGAGVLASSVGMDKDVQKRLFEYAKLPIVPFVAISRNEWEHEPKRTLAEIQKALRYPLFVKPATLGSSVGMTRVAKLKELPAALNLAAEFALKII
ncbi:MAG: D-alanine--D-alanine ligase A, partial [Candidatus Acidiferrales bacterium]